VQLKHAAAIGLATTKFVCRQTVSWLWRFR